MRKVVVTTALLILVFLGSSGSSEGFSPGNSPMSPVDISTTVDCTAGICTWVVKSTKVITWPGHSPSETEAAYDVRGSLWYKMGWIVSMTRTRGILSISPDDGSMKWIIGFMRHESVTATLRLSKAYVPICHGPSIGAEAYDTYSGSDEKFPDDNVAFFEPECLWLPLTLGDN